MGRSNHQLHINNTSLKGFTLVELLVVMGVIGVMAGIVVAAINPLRQFQRGRDSQRKADVAQVQQALEMWRADNGVYPDTSTLSTCGGSLVFSGVTYLRRIPCDPSNTTHAYTYSSTGATYTLRACLENPDETPIGTGCPSGRVSYTQYNP